MDCIIPVLVSVLTLDVFLLVDLDLVLAVDG